MQYAIGITAAIEEIATSVDQLLGYPKFGIDAATGEPVLPLPGQDPSTVPGVSLRWADVIPKHDDPTTGAYQYDENTGPLLSAAGFVPVDLPENWYPPMPLTDPENV